MDCSLPGSSIHGILQSRILEWVAISSSRASSWLRNGTWVSYISSTGRQVLTTSATWKPIPFPSSVQFSLSVMSDSLWPQEPQHAKPLCSSPTPGVHRNPCPLSRWCHPNISSFVVPFSSCPQSFPASGSFQMSQLFTSGGQSIGAGNSPVTVLEGVARGVGLRPTLSKLLHKDFFRSKYLYWFSGGGVPEGGRFWRGVESSAMEKEVYLPSLHPPRRQRNNFWYLRVVRATSVYAIIVSEDSHG